MGGGGRRQLEGGRREGSRERLGGGRSGTGERRRELQDSKTFVEDREDVNADQNYDRVYQNCNNGVTLKPNSSYDINVTVHNMSDIVVWNPWIEKAKAMSDFDDEEYNRMLCVEAGAVSQNVTIKEGQSLTFSQTLTVTSRL
ncbi:hypothetical protein FSP39_021742 [Pinctada imbricata]|uniref:Galactose mutarotase n=1 Tax=Pinctada imbricata TaxID=66713 RepID=A0AA88YFZ3_PINIB|nr:hypothetical protein FSP39_021742 [Pinctada imbricata]